MEGQGIPREAVQVIPTTSRKAVEALLQMEEYIDVIIPRGGEELIRFVVSRSKIPVIKHYKGVCHVFVDSSADLDMAQAICFNAKVQRPGVCNAMETLLVHRDIAPRFLPRMAEKLIGAGVELRGCPETRRILPLVKPARKEDWTAEYLDLILSVKIVAGPGRGDRPHRPLRVRPHRSHRHPGLRKFAAVSCAKSPPPPCW